MSICARNYIVANGGVRGGSQLRDVANIEAFRRFMLGSPDRMWQDNTICTVFKPHEHRNHTDLGLLSSSRRLLLGEI